MSYRGALPPGHAQAFPGQPSQEQRYSPQQGYYYSQQGHMVPQSQQQMQYGNHSGHQGQQQQFQPHYAQQHFPSQQQMHHHQMQQQQIPQSLPNNYGQDMYHNFDSFGQAGQGQGQSRGGQYGVPDNMWEQQRQDYQNVNVMQAQTSQHSFGQIPSPQVRQQHIHQQRQHVPSPRADAQQLQQHRPSPQPHLHQHMQPHHTPPMQHRQHPQQSLPPQLQRQGSSNSQRQPSQQPPTPTYQQNTPSPMMQQQQATRQLSQSHSNPQLAALSKQRPTPTPPPPAQQVTRFEEPSEPPPQVDPKPPQPFTEDIISVAPSALQQSEFVSLQDIQTLPPLPLTTDLNLDKVKSMASPEKPLPSSPDPLSMPAKLKQEKLDDAPVLIPKAIQPRSSLSRPKGSPHSSVSGSPAPSTRSPSITKRSPMLAQKTKPFNTQVVVSVAEECFAKARNAVHDVAMDRHPDRVDEYQKLIGTGLACLESAIHNSHSKPREEARLRLRYAAIVHEETEDLMEAETTLSKGVSLCDQHRLLDLKYCMRYQMLRVLFDRNHKAALSAVDKQISDCEAYKHVHWLYGFRLLKASFYTTMGSSTDASAFENLRALHAVATKNGDKALSVYASLLEGLAHLRTSRGDSIEKVGDCVARAAKHQLDVSVHIPQLEVLRMLLDIAATLHRERPSSTAQKLRALQRRLDDGADWHNVTAEFLIPVKKQPTGSKTISADTAAILRPGGGGESDYLVMSFMTKMEFTTLVFILSGIINMHKAAGGRKSNELWREGLKILDAWDGATKGRHYGSSVSLKTAIAQREWRAEAQAYLYVLIGLLSASHCQWREVQQMLGKLEDLVTPTASTWSTSLRLLFIYLGGVYHQGTGDLGAALSVFSSKDLEMPPGAGAKAAGPGDIALLAAMNRLWIMQHPRFRDDQATFDLLEQLQPICRSHTKIDIRTAWYNIMATITTEPPQLMNEQKQHLQDAMGGVRSTNNVLQAAITLCVMRSSFFENVVGEQALKSALAAANQAQMSGNLLWKSVAHGMLAQSYDVQGERENSRMEWDKATQEAMQAFATK